MAEQFEPVLSVITVVHNNRQDIERTILSVLNQTWPRMEYIVIDGGSDDGTLDVIRSYGERIAKVVSEKDAGIYHAMNKGLALATGDYVLFMNSGDELYGPDTIEKAFKTEAGADIYYGETEMFSSDWKSLGKRRHSSPQELNLDSFQYGMRVSHQAIIIRRAITGPYDLQYRLSSDIDWILKAVKRAARIRNTHLYIAKYLRGGLSKKRHLESLRERFAIFTKHYGLARNLLNHLVIAGRLGYYFLRHRRTND